MGPEEGFVERTQIPNQRKGGSNESCKLREKGNPANGASELDLLWRRGPQKSLNGAITVTLVRSGQKYASPVEPRGAYVVTSK
jgi:hypothetical protein